MKNSIKVLIVDDDRSSSTLIGEVVKRMGFKPVITSKATDGLNVAKLQTVHAAVIDVMLPKMSGVDLAAEFRRTRFADSPIILVSGVFKDKAFAQEAVKKSGAVDFLFKPYAAEDLTNSLKKALATHLTTEKWNLQSLLMRKLTSARARTKAIEHLEPIKGNDFPFVLSILMDAGISGSLNLVSDAGEIYGITLSHGTISEVDSSDSQAAGVLTLISRGFLAQEDWDAFQAKSGKKKFSLEKLVAEGLVSPHAVSVAKHEQILSDFKTMCAATGMQLNFVPGDESEEPPKHAVTMKELLKILATSMDEFFPETHLREFYASVMASPLHLTRPPEELAGLWGSKAFAQLTGLREAVEGGGTLEQALAKHPDLHAELFSCMHYLVLCRFVICDDVQQAASMQKMLTRYQDLYSQLKDATPDKVFRYFGGVERPMPSAVEKIYDDYVRSNHPDQVPKEAPQELHDLARKCFEIVTNAKNVMTDETKRQELFENLKNEGTARLKKSNELAAKGLEVLRKGQFSQALEILKDAEKTQSTTLQFLIQTWAEVKSGALNNKVQLLERHKRLEGLSGEEKKSPYFHMALGLVKRALGDVTAPNSFERVLEIDHTFSEARRELNSLNGNSAGKSKKIDLLSGDLSDVVSQLFRRKAE